MWNAENTKKKQKNILWRMIKSSYLLILAIQLIYSNKSQDAIYFYGVTSCSE